MLSYEVHLWTAWQERTMQ